MLSGGHVEVCAQEVNRVGKFEGSAGPGAFGHHRRRHAGKASLSPGILHSTRVQDEIHLHERDLMLFIQQHGKSVGKLEMLDRFQLHGGGRPELRRLAAVRCLSLRA